MRVRGEVGRGGRRYEVLWWWTLSTGPRQACKGMCIKVAVLLGETALIHVGIAQHRRLNIERVVCTLLHCIVTRLHDGEQRQSLSCLLAYTTARSCLSDRLMVDTSASFRSSFSSSFPALSACVPPPLCCIDADCLCCSLCGDGSAGWVG